MMIRRGLAYMFQSRARTFIVLGLLTLMVRIPLGLAPAFTEQVYSRGVFLGVRYLLDYTIGWSPIPFSYVVIVALLGFWTWKMVKKRSTPRAKGWARARLAAINVGGFLGAFIVFFHVLWGFNYERVPIEEHLGLQVDSMTVEQLCIEAEWTARQAEANRAAIMGATDDSLHVALLPADLEQEVRSNVAKTMALMDYPFAGRVRGRILHPGGWMLTVGIGGIYNPFTGEGNVSGASTPQKIPFTLAHEMAHGCGFGDEGSCNFIGMIACAQSSNPMVRYSGLMGYWAHLYNEIAVADPLLAHMLAKQLDLGIKADQRANYNNYQRYRGSISTIGQHVNDAYLHAQGVAGGIKSYDRVVLLRAAWRRKWGT